VNDIVIFQSLKVVDSNIIAIVSYKQEMCKSLLQRIYKCDLHILRGKFLF